MAAFLKKAKVQIDDIAFNKLNFRANIMLILHIVNRRRIPLPAAVYDFFNSPGKCSDDMGNETSLQYSCCLNLPNALLMLVQMLDVGVLCCKKRF